MRTTTTPVPALRSYLELLDKPGRELFAERCKSTVEYLQAVAAGRRAASTKLAKRIERHSDGKVARAAVRPDVWGPGA